MRASGISGERMTGRNVMYQVFLVDDEPWALVVLKNMIVWSDYGFIVSGEAEDGKNALERIEHTNPDLIISDIRMPGMDGLVLMEKLRELGRKTQVLLVSGYTDFEYARKAMRLGCAGYLVKPVEEKELVTYLEKIRRILDEKSEGGIKQKVTGKPVIFQRRSRCRI